MNERQPFLARWSRLKRQAAADVPAVANQDAAAAPVDVPALESLAFTSDFTAFFKNQVAQTLKRAALKKLFRMPEFNKIDPLDVYIDDYNQFEAIPPQMLAELRHAREMLFGRDAERVASTIPEAEAAPPGTVPEIAVASIDPDGEGPPETVASQEILQSDHLMSAGVAEVPECLTRPGT